ncbi:hypothetical protein T492DRAFT_859206 [Pavlovales sp. CCMP2436]|nr:hypothetical protein T492DRAFT_859206 [Pavlovales sp. CCMP2436]
MGFTGLSAVVPDAMVHLALVALFVVIAGSVNAPKIEMAVDLSALLHAGGFRIFKVLEQAAQLRLAGFAPVMVFDGKTNSKRRILLLTWHAKQVALENLQWAHQTELTWLTAMCDRFGVALARPLIKDTRAKISVVSHELAQINVKRRFFDAKLKATLTAAGIEWIQARDEADSQIAHWANTGSARVIYMPDCDSLLLAPNVWIVRLIVWTRDGAAGATCVVTCTDFLLTHYALSYREFFNMCVFSEHDAKAARAILIFTVTLVIKAGTRLTTSVPLHSLLFRFWSAADIAHDNDDERDVDGV